MKVVDYKVERTKDCIQIKTNEWMQNESNIIQMYKISGRPPITFITKVEDIHEDRNCLKGYINKGNTVVVTKVAADTAKYRSYQIDGCDYCNIPIMQVIGTFKNNKVSFDSFTPLFDKVMFERVKASFESFEIPSNMMLGRVLKTGGTRFNKYWNPLSMTVKVGDLILVKDNITTEFSLEGTSYFATEESQVVGIFTDENNLSLDNLRVINDGIIMQKYKPKYILNSSILLMPDIDYDYIDEADLDNQNMFEVLYLDKNLTKLKEHDIVILNKDLTNYVYFQQNRFNIINGTECIEGKLIRKV